MQHTTNNINTNNLIKSLTDTHTSDYNRGEALNTLIKHNYYVSIKDSLIICYINEDYKQARLLIDGLNATNKIAITQGKTIYTLKNKIAKQKVDSKQTYGFPIIAIGGNAEWNFLIRYLAKEELKKKYISTYYFQNSVSKMKAILKRKARLSKVKINKKGKGTKYIKRDIPTPPSQRV